LKAERKGKENERNAQHQQKITEGINNRKIRGKRISLAPG